jgi:hypothetical protein
MADFMSDDLLSARKYPQTWYLIDVAEQAPRLVGSEVVDLSPGAIELRHAVRRLREFAEPRERWWQVEPASIIPKLGSEHRHNLSFGPRVAYCVEQDGTSELHAGRPFRHLALQFSSRLLTPATSAEIGLYFYGRRPAVFAFTAPGEVHGYIGFDWEELDSRDVERLLRREMSAPA